MTLETEVADLTAATIALLDQINIRKDTLNAMSVAASTAAASATASADAVATQSGIATTQAGIAAAKAAEALASANSASAIVLGAATGRPSIRPSMLLDFANSKTLDSRITFARSTTAPYYDGKTSAMAEQNLLKYSQEFDNASGWSAGTGSISKAANATVAIDGTTTAEQITAAAGSNNHFFSTGSTVGNLPAGAHTFSLYVKYENHRWFALQLYDGATSFAASFDLLNGVAGALTANTSSTITAIGAAGWYRVTVTATLAAGTNACYIIMNNADQASSQVWTAAGTETISVWGAQLELRSSVTAYTPTTSAPITNYIPVLKTAVANAPRFDHDPITGESKGLLIEEQRTNLLTYSEDQSSGSDGGNLTVAANTTIAPDGTLTADTLVSSASAVEQRRYRAVAGLTAGATYTLSRYVKAAGINFCTLRGVSGGNEFGALFDLAAGTKITTFQGGVGTVVAAGIEPAGNGVYRIWVAGTMSGLTGYYEWFNLQPNNSSTGRTQFAGDGYSGIAVWGSQLEAGAFPTSYIPTTSAQVTRVADSASMTGANFSSWYRQDEGTLYVEARLPLYRDGQVTACVSDGTNNNRMHIAQNNSPINLAYVIVNGTSVANLTTTAPALGSCNRTAFVYKSNDFAATVNGGAVITDGSGDAPSGISVLNIGAFKNNDYPICSAIKRLAYYPKRLSNAELQAITA